MFRNRLPLLIAIVLTAGCLLVPAINADDDEKKDIKLRLKTAIERGDAPLPATFVLEIDAPEELDQYIYESSMEWRIEGSFVLTDEYSGGSPVHPDMRRRPQSSYERSLRSQKHLVAKEKKRAPRKKFDEETEVDRTIQWEYTFDRAGTYYITFQLRGGKYKSNQVKIEVRGDTSYDPFRDPY